jgi:hypothetical protein
MVVLLCIVHNQDGFAGHTRLTGGKEGTKSGQNKMNAV